MRPSDAGVGFRPPEACELAAALLEAPEGQRWRREGEAAKLTWHLEVSPGVVRLRQRRPKTPVRLKADRREPRPERLFYGPLESAAGAVVRVPVLDLAGNDDDDELGRHVAGFSKASRLRLLRRAASLDWAPVVGTEDEIFDETGKFMQGVAGMVTLTYPADHVRWAPTWRVSKRHLDRFFKRWERAVGPLFCLWKLETQERGAPHYHVFARIPLTVEHRVGRGRGARFRSEPFTEWLSRTWWEVVGSGNGDHLKAGTGLDFAHGVRSSDPRRIASYFCGYATSKDKERQHRPPPHWEAEGTGRWWGVRGLVTVRSHVELDQQQFVELRRLLRSYVRSLGRRPVRSLAFGRLMGGTVLVDDGPATVAMLARAVGPPGRRGSRYG